MGQSEGERAIDIDNHSFSGAMSSDTEDCNYVWNNTEWSFIPDPILLRIALLLPVRDVLNVSKCCHRWNEIIKDDYLWRKLFQRDFKVDRLIPLKPGKSFLSLDMKRIQVKCISRSREHTI